MPKNGFGMAEIWKRTGPVFFDNGSVSGQNGAVGRWNSTVVGGTGDE